MKSIRIESDGTSAGTRIFDSEGRLIHGIVKVEWELEAGGIAHAIIYVDALVSQMQTNAHTVIVNEPRRPALHWRKPEDRLE